jgi:hypothetical protein
MWGDTLMVFLNMNAYINYVFGQREYSINLWISQPIDTLSSIRELGKIFIPPSPRAATAYKGSVVLQTKGDEACGAASRQSEIVNRPLFPRADGAATLLPLKPWRAVLISMPLARGQPDNSIYAECSLDTFLGNPLEIVIRDGLLPPFIVVSYQYNHNRHILLLSLRLL